MSDESVIDMRAWAVEVKGDALLMAREGEARDIPLASVRSVLWSRVPGLPRSALKWGVALLFVPYILLMLLSLAWIVLGLPAFEALVFPVIALVLAPGLGIVLIVGHTLIGRSALDIQAGNGTVVIVGPREDLGRVRARINARRVALGSRDEVAEDAVLDADEEVFRRVERSGAGDVGMLEDIDACVRCGSLDLRPPGLGDAAVPGTFDVTGYVVCDNCHLTAVPLSFPDGDAYLDFLRSLAVADGGWYDGGGVGPAARFQEGLESHSTVPRRASPSRR